MIIFNFDKPYLNRSPLIRKNSYKDLRTIQRELYKLKKFSYEAAKNNKTGD